jgi:hypothetical protein
MIKVFDYIKELDCFIVNPLFAEIANYLGLNEWNEVVWVGRYFILDNDYGEHWFDNWDHREEIRERAEALGYEHEFLMVIDPDRFVNGKDGPCHTKEERKRFWTDVLKTLHLSVETIIEEARKFNHEMMELRDSSYLSDLEDRIELIKNKYPS